jgi:hypothetical protein
MLEEAERADVAVIVSSPKARQYAAHVATFSVMVVRVPRGCRTAAIVLSETVSHVPIAIATFGWRTVIAAHDRKTQLATAWLKLRYVSTQSSLVSAALS